MLKVAYHPYDLSYNANQLSRVCEVRSLTNKDRHGRSTRTVGYADCACELDEVTEGDVVL